MRIFVDTNVLLDVYLDRPGAVESEGGIRACAEQGNKGFIAIHTLSNAFYVITKKRGSHAAWEFIGDVLRWASVPVIDTTAAEQTRHMEMEDFEDALQIVSAEACGADLIVTRDLSGFQSKTTLPILSPQDFMRQRADADR